MTPSLSNPEMTPERISYRRDRNDKKTMSSKTGHKDDKTSLYDDATQHNPVESMPAFHQGWWVLLPSPSGKEVEIFFEIRHSQGALMAQQYELTPGFRS
jgi:hypothetical protein